MPQVAGSDALVKMEDSPGSGTFTTVSCQRDVTVTTTTEPLNTTSKCSMPAETLIEGGVKKYDVSFGGVLDDTAATAAFFAANGTIKNFQIIMAHATYEGAFFIATNEATGSHTEAQMFTASLTSSGTITES